MIITSCPLRVSLVGGSTDHPQFIEKYGAGEVISFASSLRTYVTIHKDAFGMNALESKYSVSYSKKECVDNVTDIRNELVRNCFEYLSVESMNCALTSDVYSVGSGLAASSAYLLALVKSIYVMRGKKITEYEVCKIAEKIEKKFNPLVGQQDFYGSLGGLKRITFSKNKDPQIRFLSTNIFNSMDCYLLYTSINRNSTDVLKSIDIDKSYKLLKDVEELEEAINDIDVVGFNSIINRSWNTKKKTSSLICDNPIVKEMDICLDQDDRILSHKLCGAGNGGYFLLFANLNSQLEKSYKFIKKISISETGIKWMDLQNEFNRV